MSAQQIPYPSPGGQEIINRDEEQQPFITSKGSVDGKGYHGGDPTPLDTLDEAFWRSSIFSRHAMRLNHVSAHKYGDRRALGSYRIVATCLMFVLFTFLTVYLSVEGTNRFYMCYAWWVSLGTFLFFSMSLVPLKAYFIEKNPDELGQPDGSHPFYLWKLVTFMYGFWLQAGIHLITLLGMQTMGTPLFELLVYAGPSALLVGDLVFNRIYLSVSVLLWYLVIVYSLYFMFEEIYRVDPNTELPAEFAIFDVKQPWGVGLALPLIVSTVTYLVNRMRLWLLDAGDLVQRGEPGFWWLMDAPGNTRDQQRREETSSDVSFFESPHESDISEEQQNWQGYESQRDVSRCWHTEHGRWEATILKQEEKIKLSYLPMHKAQQKYLPQKPPVRK